LSKLAWKMAPTLLVWLVGSLPFSACVSADPSDSGIGAETPHFETGLQSFYVVLKVLFFLLLIIGLFFILIRLLALRNRSAAFGRPIRSIGGVPLGQNKSLQIVSVGKALYIVGVGDNVQLLDKIDDERTVAELTELLSSDGGSVPELLNAGRWLQRLRERRSPVEEEELPSSSFGQLFQEKLQQISATKKRTQELLEQKNNEDQDRYDPS
jgi:flagellar protein FliO/FliZ